MTPKITTQFITNTLQDKNTNYRTFRNKLKPKGKVKKKRTLRVQSQGPLNDIDGVVILGLEPPVIALSDCLIDLHVP